MYFTGLKLDQLPQILGIISKRDEIDNLTRGEIQPTRGLIYEPLKWFFTL